MRDLNYYKTKLAEAEARRNRYMRQGRYGEMQQLDADIQEMRRLIADCEPKPVKQLFSRRQIEEAGLIPAVLETHLAADYLAACCYTVEDIVKQLGAMLDCDGILFCHGWKLSCGCNIEHDVAVRFKAHRKKDFKIMYEQ